MGIGDKMKSMVQEVVDVDLLVLILYRNTSGLMGGRVDINKR